MEDKIEEVDHLKLQLANVKLENARLFLGQVEAEHRAVHAAMLAKYKLTAADRYDVNTRVITRAPIVQEAPSAASETAPPPEGTTASG